MKKKVFKGKEFVGSLIVLVTVGSCSVAPLDVTPVTRTKVFTLEGEPGTKVIETAGKNFAWSPDDKVRYYKLLSGGAASETSTRIADVTGGGSSTSIEVVYTHPTDKDLVTVFLGQSLAGSEVKNLQGTSFTVTNGIPATQTGEMLPYLVCAGRGSIETTQSLPMKHMQTFVSFSLNSTSTKTGTFNKIVISDKSEAVYVAGDATYTFSASTGEVSGCSVSSTGGSKTITISLTGGVEIGRTYYAAINPANFSNGLRVTLYNGTTKLMYATTGNGDKLTKGKINDLGALDFHQIIPGKQAPVVNPEKSAISNTGGWLQTKRLWAEFLPEDCTGIKWEIVKARKGTATAVTDASTIATYATITGEGKVTYDGKTQFTAVVTPKSGFTDGWLKIKATLEGDEGYCDYAYVAVGNFIDIGGSVLWARSNLTGSSTSATLCTNSYDRGGYYMWGGKSSCGENGSACGTGKCPTWTTSGGTTGSWGGAGQLQYGGKYNSTDGITTLADADDIVYGCTASSSSATPYGRWRIPTRAQALELLGNPSSGTKTLNMQVSSVANHMYVVYTSTYKYFEDVQIGLPLNGKVLDGYPYHVSADAHYMTKSLPGTNSWTIYDYSSMSSITGYDKFFVFGEGVTSYLPYRYEGDGIRPVCAKNYPTVSATSP